VLVFTRTKFGANSVAEFLNKNGITAMALHGNKSQTARTQALSGFKSGDVRALVATDIAARGIDIDDLPHVVNYEIPNVCEDYVHRIGRTGRAGADCAAVNLVCLDEEGFMQDIERFTKQNIEVKVVEGFGAEPGEKAEPLAMGRQTIWGGIGKPPSRDVMQAAAKAARTEMLQRTRDSKAGQGDRGGNGGGRGGQGQRGNGGGNGTSRGDQQPRSQGARPPQGQGRARPQGGNTEHQPPAGFTHEGRAPRPSNAQPDPMRTNVDLMAGRGARRGGGGGGGYGGGNRGGSGNSGGGYGSERSGGFGGGGNRPRGPGGPRGSSSR
jgi:ATP-dependent RNA helicase RhlE